MEINIKTKNIELNEAIRSYINDRIGGLEKFLQGIEPLIVEVDIGRTTEHHHKGDIFRAEVQIEVPGKLLRAESSKNDLRKAIVDVKKQLKIQIEKYRGKA